MATHKGRYVLLWEGSFLGHVRADRRHNDLKILFGDFYMVGLNQDQTLATGQEPAKAKSVAVDPDAKQEVQSGKLTPEERLSAVKELLEADIALQKKNGATDSQYYQAVYKTKNGEVFIYAENKGISDSGAAILGNITIETPLPNESTPNATASKKVSIDNDGKFRLLETITRYNPPIRSEITDEFISSRGTNLSTQERAEKFADGLIKDALKTKQTEAK